MYKQTSQAVEATLSTIVLNVIYLIEVFENIYMYF